MTRRCHFRTCSTLGRDFPLLPLLGQTKKCANLLTNNAMSVELEVRTFVDLRTWPSGTQISNLLTVE
jgi:hypothetical protein